MATYKNIDDLLEIIADWQKTLLPIEAPEDKVVFTVLENVNDYIHDLDTADVEEVVHAYWEEKSMDYVCSHCKTHYNDDLLFIHFPYGLPKHCPNCGAKMDGKKVEQCQGKE